MKIAHYEWDSTTDLIAQGGFSEVFKAKDQNLDGRFVALKIYKESIFQNTSSKSTGQREYSLQEEFKLVARLSHTNVISYYGLDYIKHEDFMGRKSQYPVLIMEYASMGTLVDFQSKNSDKMMSLKLLKEIISGVGYLHSEGIIHRDLKPGNILISPNSKGQPIAKITDFGISRAILSEDTIEHSMTQGVGTPHYMAPEQIYKSKFGYRGEITERTDYWGIGILAYWMGKGELPFGNNQRDYEIIRDEIVNKEPDWTGLPSPFREIAKACLVKNANDRTVELDDLLTIIRGDTTNENNSERTVLDFSGKTRDFSSGRYEPYNTLVDPKRTTPTQEQIVPTKRKKSLPIILGVTVGIVLILGTYFFWKNYTVNDLLDRAWESHIHGQHREAYDLYQKASEYGSAQALFHLGRFHRGQMGVERDYEKSRKLANEAVEKGYVLGNYLLGLLYQGGEGIPKDSILASEYYSKSLIELQKMANDQSPLAMLWLGYLHDDGLVVEKNEKKAFEHYQKAAYLDYPVAMASLGDRYYFGEGIEKNEDIAKDWYEKANEKNSFYGTYRLGAYYQHKNNPDFNKAYEYYKRAADNGSVLAQHNLAVMYLNGIGVTQSKPEAIAWFKKAAKDGHINSMSQLGEIYKVDKEFQDAKIWFLRGANKGDHDSMNRLGVLYNTEFKNVDSASYWYEKAARAGNLYAMNNLGWQFYEGSGIEKDYEKAHDWFSKSANGKLKYSQFGLGLIYYNGFGKEKNWQEAIEWFKLAADQDHSKSCEYLGDIYVSEKNGVPQDYFNAVKYYRKGAELNSGWSMYKLGLFYYFGLGGLEKNKSSAGYWLRKACNNGENEACRAIKTYL